MTEVWYTIISLVVGAVGYYIRHQQASSAAAAEVAKYPVLAHVKALFDEYTKTGHVDILREVLGAPPVPPPK